MRHTRTKKRWWPSKLLGCLLVLVVFLYAIAAPVPEVSGPSPANCSAPEYHQFDFWVGDWDVFDVDKPGNLEARLHVESILDSCVIREDYQDVHGHKGQSFSIYDPSTKMWHQTWVTNRGELLLLNGSFQHGEMVLSGHDFANGKRREIRGVWKPEDGSVRETAVRSLDGGKTWQPWFDLIFHAHTH